MPFIHEVVPPVVRAGVPVLNFQIKGEGFAFSQIKRLRFVSADSAVLLQTGQFTVYSDSIITVPTATFPVVGTYRLQLESPVETLVQLDGAVVVNHPPVSFYLNYAEILVDSVTEGVCIQLNGIAAEQVGMVRFSGAGLCEIDDFGRPDPKTIALYPISFSVLGEYSLQLFTDNTGNTAVSEVLSGVLSVVPEALLPDITGLSQNEMSPGSTASEVSIFGSGFALTPIDAISIQSTNESLQFTPQTPPFVPEEDIPTGNFRILGDTEIKLADFILQIPGEFGVFLESIVGGVASFLASRTLALTVKDIQKPAVVFSPVPQGFDDPVEVTLRAEFTDPETGLPTGEIDADSSIYFLATVLDRLPIDDNEEPTPVPLLSPENYSASLAQRPVTTPSMLYTGPMTFSRPTKIQAIAVDAAGNTSDIAEGIYDIRNHAEVVELSYENSADSYSRYSNVNTVIKNLRIAYKALLGEDEVPGVVQVGSGSTACSSVLLRDIRRGLIDILHHAGMSIAEALPPPMVQYNNETQLKLTPGREIFDESPFLDIYGDDNIRVTRRSLEFGFDEVPTDDTYEVLLIPSYAGHSFMDPFIRVQGSSTLPDDEASSTNVVRPVSIYKEITTFTVTSSKIDKDSIVNVEDRETKSNFTDPDLERDNMVFPKDIHYREIEIALENVALPQGISISTGDSGYRVNDPVVSPSIADSPTRPQSFTPPSNVGDPLQQDTEVVLAASIGDTPKGPKSVSLTQTISILGSGVFVRTQYVSVSFDTLMGPFSSPGARMVVDTNSSTAHFSSLGGVASRILTTYRGVAIKNGDSCTLTGDTNRAGGVPMPNAVIVYGPLTHLPKSVSVDYVGFHVQYADHIIVNNTPGSITVDYGYVPGNTYFRTWGSVSLTEEQSHNGRYPLTVTFIPTSLNTVYGLPGETNPDPNIYDIQITKMYDRDGVFRLDLGSSSNSDLTFQLYNPTTKSWLTEEESLRDWPQAEIVRTLSGKYTVRVRVGLREGLIVGDVDNVMYHVILNGKDAYGAI